MTTKEAWDEAGEEPRAPEATGWKQLYLKEDWWAIWLGLGLMIVAVILFSGGSSVLKTLAINPGGLKWQTFGQLMGHFQANAGTYLAQFICWLVLFGVSARIMGIKLGEFIPSFIVLYILSMIMFGIAGWASAAKFNLEAPLVALIIGLIIANVVPLPKWMDAGFRVEYFIKLGIVLLGATFPITLVLTAGPVAIAQATIISLVTCLVIFFVGARLRAR